MSKSFKGPQNISPAMLKKDPKYSQVHSESVPCWPGYMDEIVFNHLETATYWRARYEVRDDDSDYEVATSWTEVFPEEIHKIIYLSKEEKKK